MGGVDGRELGRDGIEIVSVGRDVDACARTLDNDDGPAFDGLLGR